MSATKEYNQQNLRYLGQFRQWLFRLTKARIIDLLCDAFSKGEIEQTEIRRFFYLTYAKGIKMVPDEEEEGGHRAK